MASRGHESPLTYSEVVGAAEVQLGENGGSAEMFKCRWNEGMWITELHHYVVEPLSFLATKKKLEAAVDVEGRM